MKRWKSKTDTFNQAINSNDSFSVETTEQNDNNATCIGPDKAGMQKIIILHWNRFCGCSMESPHWDDTTEWP